jgi:hypothetical protein
MDQLKVATANASEIIGKDLLDSLSAFSKDDTLSGFDDLLSGLATKLASIDKAVFGFVARLAGIKKQNVNFTYSLGANAGKDIARAKEASIIKKTNAARATELAALNKKTAVDQLKDKFDLERIGLYAALNSATDEETKLRINSKIAILDNNEALAKKYLAELNAKNALDLLTTAAIGVYQAFGGILNSLGRGGDQGPGQALQYGTNVTNNYYNTYGAGGGMSPSMTSSNTGGNLNVATTVQIGTDKLDTVVQNSVLRTLKNGMQLQQAGGL